MSVLERRMLILCGFVNVSSEFCTIVRKIYIYTAEEAKKLSPKIKLPLTEVQSDKLLSDAAVITEEQSSTVGSGY